MDGAMIQAASGEWGSGYMGKWFTIFLMENGDVQIWTGGYGGVTGVTETSNDPELTHILRMPA